MFQDLATLDYESLPISEYSRRYIHRMVPALDYYISIYDHCLDALASRAGISFDQMVLVDYGGGHGFLSFRAKQRGVGQVIYVDFNPQAVETVNAIADKLGYGPDVVLKGDALVLRQWCQRESVTPNVVMGMDVIEHIYRLDDFFAELKAINPKLNMVFTTGSNPANRIKCHQLRKVMDRDEKLHFAPARRDFIAHHYPELQIDKLDYWTSHTRGLNYDDILRAIDCETPNRLRDRHNTCDPATGSWTERILSIAEYRDIVSSYFWSLSVENGYYNEYQGGLKRMILHLLNGLIRKPMGAFLAPYIILFISPRP